MDKPHLEVYVVLVDRKNKNTRHPVTFEFQIENESFSINVYHMGYSKSLFVVYLKLKFYWVSLFYMVALYME